MPFIIPFHPPTAPVNPLLEADVTEHFDAPFRFNSNGRVASVEQDTSEDIGARLYNVVSCVQGAKLDDPTFGIPMPVFRLVSGPGGVPADDLVAELQRQVPEASIELSQSVAWSHPQSVAIHIDAKVVASGVSQ
jgi:hypothetical protein